MHTLIYYSNTANKSNQRAQLPLKGKGHSLLKLWCFMMFLWQHADISLLYTTRWWLSFDHDLKVLHIKMVYFIIFIHMIEAGLAELFWLPEAEKMRDFKIYSCCVWLLWIFMASLWHHRALYWRRTKDLASLWSLKPIHKKVCDIESFSHLAWPWPNFHQN